MLDKVKQLKKVKGKLVYDCSGIDVGESHDIYDILQAFLFEKGSEFSIRDVSEFHGFMTALICAPKPISPSIWLPYIWGSRDATWKSKDDFASFFQVTQQINDEIVGGLGLRCFEPLFLFDEDEVALPKLWCDGFSRGEELWKGEKKDAEFIDEHTKAIHLFFSEVDSAPFIQGFKDIIVSKGVDIEGEDVGGLLKKGYDIVLAQIVDEVQALYDRVRLVHLDTPYFDIEHAVVRRTPKVGRNEICICGSGKKFKKCCLKNTGRSVI